MLFLNLLSKMQSSAFDILDYSEFKVCAHPRFMARRGILQINSSHTSSQKDGLRLRVNRTLRDVSSSRRKEGGSSPTWIPLGRLYWCVVDILILHLSPVTKSL